MGNHCLLQEWLLLNKSVSKSEIQYMLLFAITVRCEICDCVTVRLNHHILLFEVQSYSRHRRCIAVHIFLISPTETDYAQVVIRTSTSVVAFIAPLMPTPSHSVLIARLITLISCSSMKIRLQNNNNKKHDSPI
jgi:hypothetical protein